MKKNDWMSCKTEMKYSLFIWHFKKYIFFNFLDKIGITFCVPSLQMKFKNSVSLIFEYKSMSAFYISQFDCHNFTFLIILKVKSTCVPVILIFIVQFLKGDRTYVDKYKSIYNMHSHNSILFVW